MWKISLKNLLANKARLSLTGFAIVLGVSFVVASFVMSDGLRDSFGTLSKELYQGTDLEVREADEFGVDATLDESILATITAIDGVRVAEGQYGDDGVQPVRADGTIVESNGPPQFGFSWINDPELNQLTLDSGTAPGPGQFVMDIGSAEREDFVVGETYGIVTATGTYDFELSGLTRFGADNSTNGALLMSFGIEDTRRILGVPAGVFDDIGISIDDAYSASEVETAIAAALPAGFEVLNQQSLEDEQAAEFNEGIGILQNILLGFALISLFVSTFIIYNTFGIVVAQRVREIGLLRAIGAEGSQIRRSIVVEALVIGAIASAIGIVAGLALNSGLRALFKALGIELPPADLILAPRTIIIALVLGIGVTVVSSVAPAFKASRVSPIAALTGDSGGEDAGGRVRMIIGALLAIAGLVLGGIGLQGGGVSSVIALLSMGAVLVFISVAMLSPLIARQVINVIAWPIDKLMGVSGALARKNASRHPRRTATTAAALMIGLSLITGALVIGDSLKAQLSKSLETANSSDFLIAEPNFNDFPAVVANDVAALPEIGSVAAVGDTQVRVNDEVLWYNTTEFDGFAEMFDLSVDTGSMTDDGGPSVLLPAEEATEMGVAVGDSLDVEFATGSMVTATVVGTFTDQSIVDGAFIDMATVQANDPTDQVGWIIAQVADGVSAADAETAMAGIGEAYPQIDVQSSAEYREGIEDQVNQLLNIITAMLSLAILTALLGIGLTLALAIVERTRELGLLRAVGMTRRQLRRMVRWEAAAVALFGAVLGVAVGLLFGWATVLALPDSFITTVSVPTIRIIVLIAIAGVAGLVAALLPARRAGKLNVLEAIAL